MKTRNLIVTIVTIILIGSLFAGAVNAIGEPSSNVETNAAALAPLQNVRDYEAAADTTGSSYLVDAGNLYVSSQNGSQSWTEVSLPTDVIASVVATDSASGSLYVGAANEMVLYRSQNDGATWQRFALGSDGIGGITAVAVDSTQKIVYVGTDTDGAYRLRDVGSSMTVGGHLRLEEPVVEIATANAGVGMTFVRTETKLYRAENMGLSWVEVENLGSFATAVAVTDVATEFLPATVFVGTADRGLLRSIDGGYSWELANEGLNMAPGSRLYVDALAVDATNPEVLYVSTSYLLGSTTVTQSPALVAVSNNNATTWASLGSDVANGALVDDLLPVAGQTGSVYALSTASRSPLALGSAAEFSSVAVVEAANPLASLLAAAQQNLAWLLATISALTLMAIAAIDFRNNYRGRKDTDGKGGSTAAGQQPQMA